MTNTYKMLNLKVRPLTAYWGEKAVTVCDNEGIMIHLQDKGRIAPTARLVLVVNGKAYLADANRDFFVPRDILTDCNVFELSIRTDEDKILRSWVVENLYLSAASEIYDEDRLIAERAFYSAAYVVFEEELNALKVVNAALQSRVSDLENGKFTLLKFNNNEEEQQQ